MREREKGLSGVSPIRALIPVITALPSCPTRPPKGPASDTTRFQPMNLKVRQTFNRYHRLLILRGSPSKFPASKSPFQHLYSRTKESLLQFFLMSILFIFFVSNVYFIFYFLIIHFNWRLITLQYCSGFCHTLT